MKNILENKIFCYAKTDGEGFVDKKECCCDQSCESYKERTQFFKQYEKLEKSGLNREGIIKILSNEFSHSEWYKNNIK